MAETLKDVIAKLKAQQRGDYQESQAEQIKQEVKPRGRPIKQAQTLPQQVSQDLDLTAEDDYLENDYENDEAPPIQQPQQAQVLTPRQARQQMQYAQPMQQPQMMQIQQPQPSQTQNKPIKEADNKLAEILAELHNDSIYRLELLTNLQNINKNLQSIADILAEVTGYAKKTA